MFTHSTIAEVIFPGSFFTVRKLFNIGVDNLFLKLVFNKLTPEKTRSTSAVEVPIIIIIIIIALDNAPYKMLHKLKSACLIRKKPTLNKCVFKCFAKVAGLTVRFLKSTGNSFQQLGPATAKALEPQSVLWLGTTRSPRTADLKADRPETAEPLVQKATR